MLIHSDICTISFVVFLCSISVTFRVLSFVGFMEVVNLRRCLKALIDDVFNEGFESVSNYFFCIKPQAPVVFLNGKFLYKDC